MNKNLDKTKTVKLGGWVAVGTNRDDEELYLMTTEGVWTLNVFNAILFMDEEHALSAARTHHASKAKLVSFRGTIYCSQGKMKKPRYIGDAV